MTRDDEETPARRPSSIRISQWGISQAWLTSRPGRRLFTITSNAAGDLVVSAIDAEDGEIVEVVAATEDPSKAAVRALSKLP